MNRRGFFGSMLGGLVAGTGLKAADSRPKIGPGFVLPIIAGRYDILEGRLQYMDIRKTVEPNIVEYHGYADLQPADRWNLQKNQGIFHDEPDSDITWWRVFGPTTPERLFILVEPIWMKDLVKGAEAKKVINEQLPDLWSCPATLRNINQLLERMPHGPTV